MRRGFNELLTILITAVLLLSLGAQRALSADDPSTAVNVTYSAGDTELATLSEGAKYFTNQNWGLENLPKELAGLKFTRRPFLKACTIAIDVPSGAQVYIITDDENGQFKGAAELNKHLTASGWTRFAEAQFLAPVRHPLSVFRKSFSEDDHLSLPTAGRSGCVVVTAKLTVNPGNAVARETPTLAVPVNRDTPVNTDPIAGPTTNVSIPQTSIKSLEVTVEDSGLMLGQTSEVVLTVTRSESPKLVTVQFATPIGHDMGLARDEALRFIHVTYPNWNAAKAEISFEDKYDNHDGGSIGAAVGTMILSVIQGFQIDPDVAITGDISANGKVRAIGGVYAKLHGAVASKCTLVAIPLENEPQLVDAVVYNGPAMLIDTQVIGIGSLNDAIATVRTERDPKLKQAIDLFAKVQQAVKDKPASLKSQDTIAILRQVIDLAPNHLSAKVLLAVAQGKQPKTLSAGASLYYTAVAVRPVLAILKDRDRERQTHQIPSTAIQAGIADLRKLRPLADANIRPLIDAWSRFIEAWSGYQQGMGSYESLQRQWQALDDEMAKENSDADVMQKLVKEGI
jgi:Lon protease (S16) C-terminal proteolytic domain